MFQSLSLLSTPLKVLGAAILLKKTYALAQFIHFYFLRSPSYGRYLHGPGPTPYAIITGATDGIGKAIARELFEKGFNLILHGRNEVKMKQIIAEIQTVRSGGDIKYFLADATRDHDLAALLKEYESLSVTIVVNNVGGMVAEDLTIDKCDEVDVQNVIHANALFPTFFTRAILPSLRKTAERRPVLVVFVGSVAAEAPVPRMAQYSASKAYLKHLAMGLDEDEQFRPTLPHNNLSFMYMCTSSVRSASMNIDLPVPGWAYPSADVFAKTAVNSFGCGKVVVTPHLGHAIVVAFTLSLPDSVAKKMMRDSSENIFNNGGYSGKKP